MAGTRWDSRGGDEGGIKSDKDLGDDFKKAAEGEEEEITPESPDKDETKEGEDQPTLEPPGPKLWDKKNQQQKDEPNQNPKKSGPSPK